MPSNLYDAAQATYLVVSSSNVWHLLCISIWLRSLVHHVSPSSTLLLHPA